MIAVFPYVLELGPFRINAYGALAFLGFLITYLGPYRRARVQGQDPEYVTDLVIVCTVAALVGTRFLFVVTYPEHFVDDPWRALRFWEGGITYYGALLSCFLAGLAYLTWFRLPRADTMDLFSPFLALAHGLGRIGCFLVGCCYGKATTVALAIRFPTDPERLPRHPTQLYEAAFELTMAGVLNWMWLRGWRGGRVTLVWFSSYAGMRFGLEYLRADTAAEHYLLGLTLGQSMALCLLVLCAGLAFLVQPLEEGDGVDEADEGRQECPAGGRGKAGRR